jgi:hypothetical protein
MVYYVRLPWLKAVGSFSLLSKFFDINFEYQARREEYFEE